MIKKTLLLILTLVIVYFGSAKIYEYYQINRLSKLLPTKIENYNSTDKYYKTSKPNNNKQLTIYYEPTQKSSDVERFLINIFESKNGGDYNNYISARKKMDSTLARIDSEAKAKNVSNLENISNLVSEHKVGDVDVYATCDKNCSTMSIYFNNGKYYYQIFLGWNYYNSGETPIERQDNLIDFGNKIVTNILDNKK